MSKTKHSRRTIRQLTETGKLELFFKEHAGSFHTLIYDLGIITGLSRLYPRQVPSIFHGALPVEIAWKIAQGLNDDAAYLLHKVAHRARFLCLPKNVAIIDYKLDDMTRESFDAQHHMMKATLVATKALFDEPSANIQLDAKAIIDFCQLFDSLVERTLVGEEKVGEANNLILQQLMRHQQEQAGSYTGHSMELRKSRIGERLTGLDLNNTVTLTQYLADYMLSMLPLITGVETKDKVETEKLEAVYRDTLQGASVDQIIEGMYMGNNGNNTYRFDSTCLSYPAHIEEYEKGLVVSVVDLKTSSLCTSLAPVRLAATGEQLEAYRAKVSTIVHELGNEAAREADATHTGKVYIDGKQLLSQWDGHSASDLVRSLYIHKVDEATAEYAVCSTYNDMTYTGYYKLGKTYLGLVPAGSDQAEFVLEVTDEDASTLRRIVHHAKKLTVMNVAKDETDLWHYDKTAALHRINGGRCCASKSEPKPDQEPAGEMNAALQASMRRLEVQYNNLATLVLMHDPDGHDKPTYLTVYGMSSPADTVSRANNLAAAMTEITNGVLGVVSKLQRALIQKEVK